MEAYLGVSVSGLPNFFLLLGPNTGLGHTSIVFMIEAQVNYVMQAIKTLTKHRLRSLDVKPEVQARFNTKLQKRLDEAVWSAGGCKSWYLDEFGKNAPCGPASRSSTGCARAISRRASTTSNTGAAKRPRVRARRRR